MATLVKKEIKRLRKDKKKQDRTRSRARAIALRVMALVLAALIQIAILVVPYIFLHQYMASAIYIVFQVFSVIALLYVVRSDRENPSYKVAWAILLLVIPIFGWLIYLIYGRIYYTKKERARMAVIEEHLKLAQKNSAIANEHLEEHHESAASQAHYLYHYANAPAYRHTKTRFFPLGDEMFPAMLSDLESAREFIFMEYFIVEEGKMLDAILEILKRKAAQGLDVRFMYDSFGTLFKMPKEFRLELEQTGIKCYEFGTFTSILDVRYNNRDHRKICVIDGKIGYTGGVNLADEYINEKMVFGHWKDTALRIEGDAVYSMTLMFLSLWNITHRENEDYSKYRVEISEDRAYENGYVIPYTDYPGDAEEVGATVYMNMINHAHRYVYIMTPYLIIDNVMQKSLENAAKCGVDVRIITPGIPDKKMVFVLTQSYYEPLLEAGVRIFEYDPGFVHAKIFLSDDEVATVGTINMDFRSLALHFENGILMCGSDAIPAMVKDYQETLERCHEVTLKEARSLAWWKKLVLPVLRLFAPLM